MDGMTIFRRTISWIIVSQFPWPSKGLHISNQSLPLFTLRVWYSLVISSALRNIENWFEDFKTWMMSPISPKGLKNPRPGNRNIEDWFEDFIDTTKQELSKEEDFSFIVNDARS